MTESAGKQIEIEFRAIFEQNKYKKLKEFLDKNARDLGRDDFTNYKNKDKRI